MSDQNFIEQNSDKITQILLEVQERAISELYALKGDSSAEDFIRLIEDLDIKGIINTKSANAIKIFQASHTGMLESIEGFADVAEETIQTLINYNTETLLSQLDNMAQIIKKEVVKGIISGTPIETVLGAVRGQGSLSQPQLQTLINTAMNEYSRSVTKVMMDKMPSETKYISEGEVTLAHIEENYGASLSDGGGYNCRHKWEISTQKKFDHNPKKAEQLMADKNV